MLTQVPVDVDSFVVAVQPVLSNADIITHCLETDDTPDEFVDSDVEDFEVDDTAHPSGRDDLLHAL